MKTIQISEENYLALEDRLDPDIKDVSGGWSYQRLDATISTFYRGRASA